MRFLCSISTRKKSSTQKLIVFQSPAKQNNQSNLNLRYLRINYLFSYHSKPFLSEIQSSKRDLKHKCVRCVDAEIGGRGGRWSRWSGKRKGSLVKFRLPISTPFIY